MGEIGSPFIYAGWDVGRVYHIGVVSEFPQVRLGTFTTQNRQAPKGPVLTSSVSQLSSGRLSKHLLGFQIATEGDALQLSSYPAKSGLLEVGGTIRTEQPPESEVNMKITRGEPR